MSPAASPRGERITPKPRPSAFCAAVAAVGRASPLNLQIQTSLFRYIKQFISRYCLRIKGIRYLFSMM